MTKEHQHLYSLKVTDMYDIDGGFGKVRLTSCTQYIKYVDYLNCITMCGWHCCNDKYRINRPAGANSHLLLYTISGSGELQMNDRDYALTQFTAVIIPSNTPVSYYTSKNGLWEFYWIHFKGKLCEPLIDLISLQPKQLVNFKDCNVIPTLTECVLSDSNRESPDSMIQVSETLSYLLHEFIRHQPMEQIFIDHWKTITKKAVEYIQNNYRDAIGTGDISRNLYISCEHLIRVFKEDIGVPPYEFLYKYRIKKAKELLGMPGISVDKIASMVGFRSHSNFSKKFKSVEGVTPTAFRKGV